MKEKASCISVLQDELEFLLDQKREKDSKRLKPKDIEKLFWKDIRSLEKEYLRKATHEDIDVIRDLTPNYYIAMEDLLPKYVKEPLFPVVPSWALLQESTLIGERGIGSTGLSIASKHLGMKIATWRNMGKNKPIFRLWYIQHLFFHKKNLSLVSFYYDFITQTKYSEHIEIYQYNHITNYSFIDEDISYMVKDALVKKLRLPQNLTSNIYGNQVKTISLSAASGSSYRCVLPDRDVITGLNKWIKSKQKQLGFLEDEIAPQMQNYATNLNKEIFTNSKKRNEIERLGWLSFKELRDKVATFAIVDDVQSSKRH